ncbi:hypothetical protein JHK86_030493 [Glycine max]|nr:hypothetical protein JHK86_030493 [Glycine max]
MVEYFKNARSPSPWRARSRSRSRPRSRSRSFEKQRPRSRSRSRGRFDSLYCMESSAEKYAAFKQKVSRTVYLDNMSPQVTESVIRTALDQFATVKNVKFIPNYIGPSNQPQCALVELDSAKKAKEILSMIAGYPFMMSGQPRPVRARPAVMEMFDDQPIKPNRKIKIRWLEPSDPDFELAKEVKNLTRKHAAEVEFLDKLLLEDEEKLAKQQEETLKVHYKKFKMIEGIMADKTAHRLARKYNLHVADDWARLD